MLNLFSLRSLSRGSRPGGSQEKVQLTAAEEESLPSELADAEEREAHLKSQLDHIVEILRSARLSGYMYIRTRWTTLPGDPPPIDDSDVNDWVSRFIVLHGDCIFIYLSCSDLSPQDATPLSDIVEAGLLPSFKWEDDETQYAFYILSCLGFRYECSSSSKIQVDSWLSALRTDCKLEFNTSLPNGSIQAFPSGEEMELVPPPVQSNAASKVLTTEEASSSPSSVFHCNWESGITRQ